MGLKSKVPPGLKRRLHLSLAFILDLTSLRLFRFPRCRPSRIEKGRLFESCLSLTQPINRSEWAEPKIHNIKLAVRGFMDCAVYPGELFSFWKMVGNPSLKNGYQKGINIIRDRLDFDTGGGLCQLSGLLYHLAVSAGLEIVERHPHSTDLYTDQTRYTPLGSDATVAFGYKDLRIRNNLDRPFCFRVKIEDFCITGSVCSPSSLAVCRVEFLRTDSDDGKKVKTVRIFPDGREELMAESFYKNTSHDVRI